MNADEKDIEWFEQTQESFHPFRGFDNMLDDEVIPGSGEGGKGAMKAVEEPGTKRAPRSAFASSDKPHREGGATGCMVRTLVELARGMGRWSNNDVHERVFVIKLPFDSFARLSVGEGIPLLYET